MSCPARPILIALAAAVGLAVMPSPAAAVAAPATGEVAALPGATAGAVVVGWDDPAFVRIVASDGTGAVLAEAWSVTDGSWQRSGDPVPLRRLAAPSELNGFTARLADAASRVPVTRSDRLRLLSATLDGAPRAVAVASVFVSATCCTSLVAIDAPGGRLNVEHLAERLPPIDTALALDLDGDGNDEILVRTLPMTSASTRARLVAYQWRDGAFVELARADVPDAMLLSPFALGETDGRPGAEAGLIDHAGLGRLARVSRGEGAALRIEIAGLLAPRDPREDVTGVAALPDGRLVIATAGSSYLAAWPAGEQPQVVGRGSAGGAIIGVLEGDSGARIVTRHPITTGLAVMDAQLRRIELAIESERVGRSVWLPEYTGPVPGEARDAAVAAGRTWIQPVGGELAVAGAHRFAGAHPLALFGPDDEWLLLLRSLDPRAQSAAGGPLRARSDWLDDRLSVVPSAIVRGAPPGPAVGDWLALRDAAIVAHEDADPADLGIAVADAGFAIEIRAAPDSIVHLHRDGSISTHHVGARPLRIDLPSDREARVLVAVVEPSGASRSARLTVAEVVIGAPPLRLEAVTPLFSPRVVVQGRTAPSAAIRVDGVPVAVDSDGRFRVEVEGGLLPQAVAVDAVDPLGTTTVAELSVVGYVDYVGVAWPAVLAVVALVIGTVLAWRRPPSGDRRSDVELDELDAAG